MTQFGQDQTSNTAATSATTTTDPEQTYPASHYVPENRRLYCRVATVVYDQNGAPDVVGWTTATLRRPEQAGAELGAART